MRIPMRAQWSCAHPVCRYHDAAFGRAAARLSKRRSGHVPAVPKRTPRPLTAFDVPTLWTEPPLMIASPDHYSLSEAEHLIEEQHRRDLYEAITARCWCSPRAHGDTHSRMW